MQIVTASTAHLPGILAIFNQAVRETFSVWTEKEDTLADRRRWLNLRRSNDLPVLVAADESGDVIGYGGYGPFRGYSGFDGAVEHSVYVAPAAQGRGVGRALLGALILKAEQDPTLHTMIGCVDNENPASVGLHEALGFERQGLLRGIGQKFGKRRDLAMMVRDISGLAHPT